jgi:hypothetical protein
MALNALIQDILQRAQHSTRTLPKSKVRIGLPVR